MIRTSYFLVVFLINLALPPTWNAFGQQYSIEVLPEPELEQRINALLEDDPDNAAAYFQLGLLHTFAYAWGWKEFVVEGVEEDGVPFRIGSFGGPFHSGPLVLPRSQERMNHLASAVEAFRECTARAPDTMLHHYALGYAYFEVSRRTPLSERLLVGLRLDAAKLEQVGERITLEDLALEEFRATLAATDNEIQQREFAVQASLHIYDLLRARSPLSDAEVEELDRVKQAAGARIARLECARGIVPRTDSDVPPALCVAIEATYPLVPLDRNAAEYYLLACDALFPLGFLHEAPIPYFGSAKLSVPVEDYPDAILGLMGKIAEANSEALALLHKAGSFPDSRYPMDFSQGEQVELPHLAKLRTLARVAGLQVLYAASTGDGALARQSLVDIVSIARSLTLEPHIASQTHLAACGDVALEMLEQVLNRMALEDADLASLQDAIAGLEDPRALRALLEGEKWMASLPQPAEEPEKESETPKAVQEIPQALWSNIRDSGIPSRSPEEARAEEKRLQAEATTERKTRLEYATAFLSHVTITMDAVFQYVRLPEEYDPEQPALSLQGKFGPLRRPLSVYIRLAARSRVAQTALAVERFRLQTGALPSSLEELVPEFITAGAIVDPFGGETLQYDPDEEGYVVYSVSDELFNDKVRKERPDAPSAISFTVRR